MPQEGSLIVFDGARRVYEPSEVTVAEVTSTKFLVIENGASVPPETEPGTLIFEKAAP